MILNVYRTNSAVKFILYVGFKTFKTKLGQHRQILTKALTWYDIWKRSEEMRNIQASIMVFEKNHENLFNYHLLQLQSSCYSACFAYCFNVVFYFLYRCPVSKFGHDQSKKKHKQFMRK